MTRHTITGIAFPLTIAALGAPLTACGDDDEASESTLLVVNDSDFAIDELFITDVDASGWGPDLLADNDLEPGEQILVTDIQCDVYDVLLIDEEGVECQLLGLDLCFDDATWVIDNDTCVIFDAASDRS